MIVPVAANFVMQSLEEKQAVAERFKGAGYALELEVLAVLFRPKVLGDRSIGAEHKDHPLLGLPGRTVTLGL